jgi:hypothetical protein
MLGGLHHDYAEPHGAAIVFVANTALAGSTIGVCPRPDFAAEWVFRHHGDFRPSSVRHLQFLAGRNKRCSRTLR